MQVDLGDLGFEEGGRLLVKRALAEVPAGHEVEVAGSADWLETHLRAWCRAEGHRFRWDSHAFVARGSAESERWSGSETAGGAELVVDHAPGTWGLAARGARVESGGPDFGFALVDKMEIWTDDASRIYAQAAAAQWDPETAIPWAAEFSLPDHVEDAVVQIMTYLIENETAALIIPSRFIAQMHPHFREVMQTLAIQAADEARHVEIFTRRALLKRPRLGLSTVSGQLSLQTLLNEPNFAIASFLLSVLGEGTFLALLWFLERYAPDPVTSAVTRLAAQDEARHVAFGLAHLRYHVTQDPGLLPRLADAVHRRHDALRETAGLNAEVFDSLILMAAGSWEHDDLRKGQQRVIQLIADMDDGRRKRLLRLGFEEWEAAELSSLHTRNFM